MKFADMFLEPLENTQWTTGWRSETEKTEPETAVILVKIETGKPK